MNPFFIFPAYKHPKPMHGHLIIDRGRGEDRGEGAREEKGRKEGGKEEGGRGCGVCLRSHNWYRVRAMMKPQAVWSRE